MKNASADAALRQTQSQFDALRDRLKTEYADRAAKWGINIYPCATAAPRSCRGTCLALPKPAAAGQPQVDESEMPAELKDEAHLPEIKELHVGDYLHVAVTSPVSGVLHLFNLGTSGTVAKLLPHAKASTQRVAANTRYFVTGGMASTFRQDPYIERGASANGGPGRANGFPERLLAIVETGAETPGVEATDLNPEWSRFNAVYRGTKGNWTSGPAATRPDFWSRPDWVWGYIEVPVV